MEQTPALPTSDERLLAGLSHISILFFGLGIVAPLVVWVTQRRKSAYVAFQSLQALGYQMLMWLAYLVVSFLIAGIAILVMVAVIIIGASTQNEATLMLSVFSQFFIYFGIFCLMGLYILGGLIGGILCLTGKQFYYPLFGRRLERYLAGNDNQTGEVSHA